MMIPWLFLILFIDGFSLATDVETLKEELASRDERDRKYSTWGKCAYNATKALPPNLPCLPEGHCKEIQQAGSVLGCTRGYQLEYTVNNSVLWRNQKGDVHCSHNPYTVENLQIVDIEHIRCRKIRRCFMDEYYISTECDPGSTCEQKRLRQKPEKCHVDIVNNIADYTCEKHGRGLQLRGEYTAVQLLRCNIADCDSTYVLEMTDSTCIEPNCKQITVNKYSISCPDGYVLEGQLLFDKQNNEEYWTYFKDQTVNCYGKVINPKSMETYTKYRCMKPRECDTDALFKASECQSDPLCQNVIEHTDRRSRVSNYECKTAEGFQLEYLVDGSRTRASLLPRWTVADHLSCEKIGNLKRMRVHKENMISEDIPHSVKCRKKKGCDLNEFYIEECPSHLDCEKPTQNSDVEQTVDCNEAFFLRVHWVGNYGWSNALKAICKNGEFQVVTQVEGNDVIETYRPHEFKCVRKKLEYYFEDGCEENAKCHMPRNHKALGCDSLYGLQVKIEGGAWREAKASCEWDYFAIYFNDAAKKMITPHAGVRCIRRYCTQCANPCPSCTSSNNSTANFKTPQSWNDCAKFTCGIHSRMIIENKHFINTAMKCSSVDEENAISIWNVNGTTIEANSVKCEYLCSLKSPLTSECHPDETQCETWVPHDDKPIPCGRKMFYRFGNSAPVEIINKISCDLQDGQWKDKYNIIPTNSNVYCHQGDCDEDRIFPSCNVDDDKSSICVPHNSNGHRYFCSENSTFWSRVDERKDVKWIKMNESVTELLCLGGKIVLNGTAMIHEFQATCREAIVAEAQEDISLVSYIGVTFSVLAIITIVTTTIVLRVAGKGWIHTVIIEWIRDRRRDKSTKRGTAYSISPNGTLRSPSLNSPTISSSRRKSEKTTSRRVKTKQSARPVSIQA